MDFQHSQFQGCHNWHYNLDLQKHKSCKEKCNFKFPSNHYHNVVKMIGEGKAQRAANIEVTGAFVIEIWTIKVFESSKLLFQFSAILGQGLVT